MSSVAVQCPAPATVHEEVFLGSSATVRVVRDQLERVARMPVPVVLEGESGTGKGLLARWIHQHSGRTGQLVKISCPALPRTLVESELFGYNKGAFTGALASRRGWVELADGGTLFLDQIAELERPLQAKLLEFLQEGRYFPIGAAEPKRVDLRVISAASRSLASEVDGGSFRRDLLYRLNVVTIKLPPLRERPEDIPELIEHFLLRYTAVYGRTVRPLSQATIALMRRHQWPGNVRELQNLVQRYVVLGSEAAVRGELLRLASSGAAGTANKEAGAPSLRAQIDTALRELERKAILRVLCANNWNRRKAARELHISYRTLFYKLKHIGLDKSDLMHFSN